MGKAVFMGRPGVLYPKVKREEDFEEYKFFDDVPENLTLLGNMGFSLVIIGNSKNDEHGASYRGAFDRVSESIRHMTPSPIITATCYHDKEECDCKLPKPKMFLEIIEEVGFDTEESFMIAGYPADFNAARKAGIKNIVIVTTGSKKWSKTAEEFAIAKVSSFSKAIGTIQEMMLLAAAL